MPQDLLAQRPCLRVTEESEVDRCTLAGGHVEPHDRQPEEARDEGLVHVDGLHPLEADLAALTVEQAAVVEQSAGLPRLGDDRETGRPP